MDCCSSYPDYRHHNLGGSAGASSAGTGGNPFYSYNQSSVMRCPPQLPTVPMYRNGGGPSGGGASGMAGSNAGAIPPNNVMHSVRVPSTCGDAYDRFMYQNGSAHYNNSYGNNLAYDQPGVRENMFYNHHYEGYRMPPTYSYHHREHYNSEMMYGGRNAYMIRDASPSPYQQNANTRMEYGNYHHHHSAMSRDYYYNAHGLSSNVDPGAIHPAHGSLYNEYSSLTSPSPYLNGPSSSYPLSHLSATGMFSLFLITI